LLLVAVARLERLLLLLLLLLLLPLLLHLPLLLRVRAPRRRSTQVRECSTGLIGQQ
jgi:hypothetical protein